jgi:hypothetical protein
MVIHFPKFKVPDNEEIVIHKRPSITGPIISARWSVFFAADGSVKTRKRKDTLKRHVNCYGCAAHPASSAPPSYLSEMLRAAGHRCVPGSGEHKPRSAFVVESGCASIPQSLLQLYRA